jgi:hypothetical protein
LVLKTTDKDYNIFSDSWKVVGVDRFKRPVPEHFRLQLQSTLCLRLIGSIVLFFFIGGELSSMRNR